MLTITPVDAIRVVADKLLVGSKLAVQQGNTVYVSPAMYDLISHATSKELQRLGHVIEVLTLPQFSDVPPSGEFLEFLL